MTSPVVTIDADADLHAAFTLFRAHAVRPPAGWADVSQPTTDSDAATTLTDETRYPDPSDPVRLYVSDDLIRIGPDATLHQIAQRLAAEGVGALVVVHGDRVLGVISERDVIRAVAAGKDLDSITAADLDARDVVTCTPDTTVRAAAGS